MQLGFHAAAHFAEALAPLGLEPRHAGLLRSLAANEGVSQQGLGDLLGLNGTRMVFLVDDLEHRGFVERRKNQTDRRSNALFLTPAGQAALESTIGAAAAHQAELSAGLTPAERRKLTQLLRKVAAEQGIDESSLPGPPPNRPPA